MGEEIRHTTIAEELASGNTITYFTIGVSMRPLLVERQTHVMIAPIEEAKDDDIVLYIRKNGAHVLHRLMKQDEKYYYMRGDNTFGYEPIEKSQAIGVVTSVYKNGKYIDVKSDKKYLCYVKLWRINYPLRWLWMKCKRMVYAVLRHPYHYVKHLLNRLK